MEFKKRLAFNIVIIGGGNAGLIAAIEARNHGAGVLLIEKGPKARRGGNSRVSGGHFRVVHGSEKEDFPFLLEGASLPEGQIEIAPYTKPQYYADLMRVTEGLIPPDWAEKVINESLPTVRWMREQGMVWGLNTGQQIKLPNGKLFWPSGVTVLTAGNSGEGLVEQLYGIAEAKGTAIMYDTAARSLIVDADGVVTGLTAISPEGMLQIGGRAIIMACGGFEGSPEMRRRYLGEGWDLVKLRGTRYNTGDGLRMALDIGAQTAGHWGGCHASVVSEDSPQIEAEAVGAIRYSYLFGVMVNADAKRFVDEGENFIVYTYAKMGRQIAKQPHGIAYQIFDAKALPMLRPEYVDAVRAESNTLAGLAEEIGLDPQAFADSIEEYNNAIAKDVPFDPSKRDGLRTDGLAPDKTNWARPIDEPPFVAYAVVCGITFTYGGLRVDEKTRILDTRDMVIEGLYGIGEMSGGMFYHNYPSGTGLVKGAVAARIAAVEAVKRVAEK